MSARTEAVLGSWVVRTIVFPFSRRTLHNLENPAGIGQVQMGRRLVQEQKVGILGQGPGDGGQLALAGAQRPDGLSRFGKQVDDRKGFFDRPVVVSSSPPEPPEVGRTAEGDIFPDLQIEHGRFVRGDMTNQAAPLPPRQKSDRPVGNQDLPFLRLQPAQEKMKKRGFTGSVRTDEGGHGSGLDDHSSRRTRRNRTFHYKKTRRPVAGSSNPPYAPF